MRAYPLPLWGNWHRASGAKANLFPLQIHRSRPGQPSLPVGRKLKKFHVAMPAFAGVFRFVQNRLFDLKRNAGLLDFRLKNPLSPRTSFAQMRHGRCIVRNLGDMYRLLACLTAIFAHVHKNTLLKKTCPLSDSRSCRSSDIKLPDSWRSGKIRVMRCNQKRLVQFLVGFFEHFEQNFFRFSLSRFPVGSSARISAGSLNKRPRKRNALTFAARQFRGKMRRLPADPEQFEKVLCASEAFAFSVSLLSIRG